jgi:hypothetical protein
LIYQEIVFFPKAIVLDDDGIGWVTYISPASDISNSFGLRYWFAVSNI